MINEKYIIHGSAIYEAHGSVIFNHDHHHIVTSSSVFSFFYQNGLSSDNIKVFKIIIYISRPMGTYVPT